MKPPTKLQESNSEEIKEHIIKSQASSKNPSYAKRVLSKMDCGTTAKLFLTKNLRTSFPPVAKAEDVWMESKLDLDAGTLNLILGYCNPLVQYSLSKQCKTLDFISSRFMDDQSVALASEIIRFVGIPNSVVNIKLVSGSQANEDAIKRVVKYTKKRLIMSPLHAFFGNTMATMALSGQYFDKSRYPYLDKTDFIHFEPCIHGPSLDSHNKNDCHGKCLEKLKCIIEHKEEIAGIFYQPIDINSGVIIPSKEYVKGLRGLCYHDDIPLVFDEIQTAMGWLGENTASHYFDIFPDIMTLGKALAAGQPLAASVLDKKFDVLEFGESEFTNGASPISCAVSRRLIQFIEEGHLLDRARILERQFKDSLLPLLDSPIVKDIRGIGAIWGIELERTLKPSNNLASRIQDLCWKKGVWIRVSDDEELDNTIILKPALTISADDLRYGLAILSDTIGQVTNEQQTLEVE